MLYLSQVLGRPIYDASGDRVAAIRGIIVRYGSEDYPPALWLVARFRRRDFFISHRSVAALGEHGAKLSTTVLDLTPFERREGEVLLGKDVLDNQLIDVDGKRVVRVNDVQLI